MKWLQKILQQPENNADNVDTLHPSCSNSLTTSTLSVLSPEYLLKKFNLTLDELKSSAGADWPDICRDREALDAFSDMLYKHKQRSNGIIPADHTSNVICLHCGPVKLPPELAGNGRVFGCPWC